MTQNENKKDTNESKTVTESDTHRTTNRSWLKQVLRKRSGSGLGLGGGAEVSGDLFNFVKCQ